MHKRPSSRYEIWSAQTDPAKADKPKSTLREPRDAQVVKLDDLKTSLLLYNYGLPVATVLNGICTPLPDGQSTKCATRKISSELVDFTCEAPPFHVQSKPHAPIKMGSPVRLELEEIGAFGGIMSSQTNDGFQVTVDSSHRSMLSGKIADLAAKRGLSPKTALTTDPSVTRIELTNKACDYEDHHGILRKGTIVHVSQVDALIRAPTIPPVPAIIVFKGPRRYAAEVTNTFEIGFIVSFCRPIPSNELFADMKFSDT